MAFETGYAGNEFHLQEKLTSFMMRMGWSVRAQIDTFDTVYYSTGEDGYRDIYVRAKCGVVSPHNSSFCPTQFDYGDGYTGYMNLFAYQYFPEGGDGYDGYGEVGRFGPRFLYHNGGDSLYYSHAGNPTSWRQMNGLDSTVGYGTTSSEAAPAFDGVKTLYAEAFGGFGYFFKYDIVKEQNSTLEPGFSKFTSSGRSDVEAIIPWIDPDTRKKYVFLHSGVQSQSGSTRFKGTMFRRWNVESGYNEFGFQSPPWSTVDSRNTGYRGDTMWDTHNRFYAVRGKSYDSGTNTAHWAMYHIPTDTWTLLSPDLPFTVNDAHDELSLMWLDKSISGFSSHRIYLTKNLVTNNIYYIDIDENNGLPTGSWTSVGGFPTASGANKAHIFHNNSNRFFLQPGDLSNRALYYADMVPGTLTWNLISSTFLPVSISSFGPKTWYLDGYASKVRTSLYDKTQYWFIGDKNHIKILTRSDGEDSFCYAGLLAQYSSDALRATVTSRTGIGSNEEIQISVQSGEFVVGEYYYIVDATDEGGVEITNLGEGIPRKFKAAERISVTSVNPGVSITVSQLKNIYPVGSKIGKDPQPVGVTLDGLDKIQMTNYINTLSSDASGSYDMSKSIYNLKTTNESLVNASGGDRRRNFYFLWPITAIKDNTELLDCGKDLRGRLTGVFAVSSTGAISTGDTITVGTNTFMIFDIDTSKSYYYAMGPIEG